MDGVMLDFAWLIASFIFGIMLGCLTGLIPGFHVNNVALIALSLSPVAVATVSYTHLTLPTILLV